MLPSLLPSNGRIDFENVTFRYANTVTDAISNLTLHIEPGKTYALVGASGAGKSTILSLILRLYDPTSGAVKIDGRDLRSVTQKSLREQIGLVTQETFLFHDTIFSNIQFGRLDATPEEVREAARAAYAHDFIMAQPKSYQTVIGDKGCLLSGGQQQRLAIARAVLKNAPILLLDEATSSLDSESEQQIQKALAELATGRTVIAIAHRLIHCLIRRSNHRNGWWSHQGDRHTRRASRKIRLLSAVVRSPIQSYSGGTGH